MKIIITLLFLSSCIMAFAQPYGGKALKMTGIEKAAGCTPPSTSTYMELNNVRMLVHTAGNMWQVPGQNLAQYEVPKNSGIMAMFTSALWLGGVDINDQLKLAALRYRNGQDYWTGPLSQGAAETNFENCSKYDKHFVTAQDEIRLFDAWFTAGEQDAINGTNTQAELYPDYEIPNRIKDWPAHGDVAAGQDYYLAPFFDRNDDGTYQWELGDYPWHDIHKTKACGIDRSVSLYGDLNYWWVMNDKGNIHTETGADPIGMEIRAQAFSFASNDEINNMTFYNYELINRGTQTLYDTYFGSFTDGALGDPFDDYVGCDVGRGLGYYYNGDNFDGENAGFLGYGDTPPAVGVDFFEGPFQDDDGIDNAYGIGPGQALNGIGYGDGIIDNERYGMRRFLYYSNIGGGNINQTDPIAAADYYNYLRGFWKDGSPFYYGGSGHISDPQANTSAPCEFMFPGDTDPLGWGTGGQQLPIWTEQTAGNVPYDRRFVQSAGPFVLKPGAVNNITVGVVWARATTGDPFASVAALQIADDKAQALFENCFKVLEAPHAPTMVAQELENEVILTLSNPANSNNANEEYIELDPFLVSTDSTADFNYRFQGYQIYQLVNDEVSISDLMDVTKARLTAQCDIEDDIDRIINFEFDEGLQASIPVERVDGENEGLLHSFQVTTDLFAQGDNKLVNFKRYYFLAVAYAHNNFKEYDPTDPFALDGQQKRYIASRKAAFGEVKVIEVIPHNPMPEADGTAHFVNYGSTPQITRLDGYGNGNRSLELTSASIEYILANGFMDTPTYDFGKGPINVKVIDPLNVVDGHFECKFLDYDVGSNNNSNGADTASWVIYRYNVKNGTLLDSVKSDLTIAADNEQLIPQWGVSVQIHQEQYFLPEGASGGKEALSTNVIESEMEFGDSSKLWLTGVFDNSSFYPTNWIRSGIFYPNDDVSDPGYACLPSEANYLNPCNYPDYEGVWDGGTNPWDSEHDFSSLIGGIVAPQKLVGFEADYMPMVYYNTAASLVKSYKRRASISYLPSVDIVITNDKSKWTRCPVIEQGRDPILNVGGAEGGEMRKSPSVDINGNPEPTGTGMGWFPGYAIDLESGARLYMAFGENSFLGGENGADMIWNPTDRLVDGVGTPLMGGVHPIYIMSYKNKDINNDALAYNYDAYVPGVASDDANNDMYNDMLLIESNNSTAKRNFYSSISWIAFPLLETNHSILETDVRIKLRVNKEYKDFSATGQNNGSPMYSWNMDEISTEIGSIDQLSDALNLINVVPNPYMAFSEYERNRIDNRVKITNLPEKCEIKIYSTQGKLIKTFSKDSPVTFIDWLLVNNKNIPVASGVYLIHIDVPGVGERIIKSFVAMRQVDLHNL